MSHYIDEAYWRQALSKPNWYLLLKDDFERLEKLAEKEEDYAKRKQIKGIAYSLVEEAVRSGRLPMAESGDNLDVERKTIDTIVVHHTKNKPGMTLDRLNAVQLLRIYGRYFANPTNPKEKPLKGQPIWSGHFYHSSQVFWGYHWLIREDGSSEQILDDNYVGWHAGNWDINTRSVGICLDDDLSDKKPSKTVIQAVANTIKQHYPNVNPTKILGHCEVNNSTECPGRLFLESWKRELLDSLQ
jgi:hypothetical protein